MPGLEADCVLLLTPTPARKGRNHGVLVDWPGEQPAPSALIFGQRIQPAPSAEATLAAEQQARSREERTCSTWP